jgi:hypothetical protein
MSDSDENERTHTVGYKRPPVETRFKKGHVGRPRGKAVARKDFLEELLEQLDERVAVTENGKRRKMPGLTVGARNMAQAFMKGDAKARAQFIQLLKQRRGSSPAGAPPETLEKPRRNLEEIMRDFAQDMHEETYQMVCDLAGTTNISDEDVYAKVIRLIHEKHSRYLYQARYKLTHAHWRVPIDRIRSGSSMRKRQAL